MTDMFDIPLRPPPAVDDFILSPLALDHDHTDKTANHCKKDQNEDNGDFNGPFSWREEIVQGMVCVHEGLEISMSMVKGIAGHQGIAGASGVTIARTQRT
jgi:hypothetical protein